AMLVPAFVRSAFDVDDDPAILRKSPAFVLSNDCERIRFERSVRTGGRFRDGQGGIDDGENGQDQPEPETGWRENALHGNTSLSIKARFDVRTDCAADTLADRCVSVTVMAW